MRLGYFAMPVHPLHRNWAETLKEDREAVILADRLGFHDAFIGEHLTDKAENITSSMMFNATLISDTRQIKLATGTTLIEYVQNLRIEEAKRLLEGDRMSAEAVAAEVGYENQAFFRRLFRRCTGLTPGQYRRMFAPIAFGDAARAA